MPDVGFGGTNLSTTSFTDNWVSCPVGIGAGRAMANGSTAVRIVALYATVQGRSGARTVYLTLGSASTGGIGIPSSGSANANTGWQGTNAWLASAGTYTFTVDANPNGSFWFARGGSGTITDSYGTTWAGQLSGGYRYEQAPTAPGSLNAAVGSGSGTAALTWVAPSDNGGTGVTGYRIEWATNAAFTTGTGNKTIGAVLSDTVTGLTPGLTYYFRVAAINAVTTAASTWSTYSSSVSLALLGGVKIADSTDQTGFVSTDARYGVQVFNQYNFVPANVRQYDAASSSWISSLDAGMPYQIPLTALNGWVPYDTSLYYGAPYVYRSSTGWVVVAGMLSNGVTTTGTPIFQLPVGFRPAVPLLLPALNSSNAVMRTLRVGTDGVVSLYGSGWTTGWISFNNISFPTELLNQSIVGGYANGWSAYDTATWGDPILALTEYGLVYSRGMVGGGSAAGQIKMFTLPPEYNFPVGRNEGFPTVTSATNSYGRTGIRNNEFYVGDTFSPTTYMNIHSYWDSGTLTWTNVSYINSWTSYNAAAWWPGQYVKRPDGIVMLRGLIMGGVSGTSAFVLPAGYRPSRELIFAQTSNASTGRVDIAANGNVKITAYNGGWISLSGIAFAAYQ